MEYLRNKRKADTTPAKHLAGMLAVQDILMSLMLSFPEVVTETMQEGGMYKAFWISFKTFIGCIIVCYVAYILATYVMPPMLNFMYVFRVYSYLCVYRCV